MSETEKKCADDKAEVTEEAPIITSHQLELVDTTLNRTAPSRASLG